MNDELRLFTIHDRDRNYIYRDTVVATDPSNALQQYRAKIGEIRFEDNSKWSVEDLSSFLLQQGYVVNIQRK
ncbi:MAG: hypothetical protein AABW89_04615 [Nanoarchaeota archaeon]